MKKILTLSLVILLGASVLTTDAYAKRFGGGKSFGKQREQISQPAAPRPAGPAPAAAPLGGRSWLGPIAGLMAGGLLASLFMGHGFDGIKLFDILLLVGLAAGVYFILRKMRQARPQQQPLQYAGMNPPVTLPPQAMSGTTFLSAQPSTRPDWFEDEPFLRAAKGHFIRLQEAYDRADVNDIREYTTPEVFAEIQLQLQERGSALNKTDVLQLDAAMLNVVTENDLVIASVRFTGQIREAEGAPATALDEIWHIQKSATDQNAAWYVAGIQQAA
jgi:predicted lipid-binding transport protein (Tim44 family)